MSESKGRTRSVVKDLPPAEPPRRWPGSKKPILAKEEWWRYAQSDPRSHNQAPRHFDPKA